MRDDSTTVYLVDASPYVFRAFHSLPTSITDPAGRPVNAIYGFTSFLLKLLTDKTPSHLAVAFDGSLTTSFRNDLFPAYKAHREPPPEELYAQLEDCRAMAEALGSATFIDDRYEADDILASMCERLDAEGHAAVVVTSDKDLAQLVGDRIVLWDFAADTLYDTEAVREKFGVRPEQIADYLGLAGDSVDNIPGVAGVGKKSAAALLAHYDRLEDALDDLPGVAELPVRGARSLAAKLERDRDTALLSKRLATVVRDAPFAPPVGDLAWRGADRELFGELCERLGFTGIRERVPRFRER